MKHSIGKGCELNKAIVAENVEIGDYVKLGVGEEAPITKPIRIFIIIGLVTIGEKSVIPSKVTDRKELLLYPAITTVEDYTDVLSWQAVKL